MDVFYSAGAAAGAGVFATAVVAVAAHAADVAAAPVVAAAAAEQNDENDDDPKTAVSSAHIYETLSPHRLIIDSPLHTRAVKYVYNPCL